MKRWYVPEGGFVLLTTIMLISMLTVVVLSLTQGVFLYSKTTVSRVGNHQTFYQLETMAYELASMKPWLIAPDCMIEPGGWNRIGRLLRSKSCTVMAAKQAYRYLIQDLGLYPSVCVLYDGSLYGSHHWLLSVMNREGDILQLRMARRFTKDRCHRPESPPISEGMVSWRYLSHHKAANT